MIVFPMLNCTWILLYHISHDCSFCGLEEKYYCKYDFFFFFFLCRERLKSSIFVCFGGPSVTLLLGLLLNCLRPDKGRKLSGLVLSIGQLLFRVLLKRIRCM